MGRPELRWRLADEGEPTLLDGLVDRVPGRGELAGLELLHVNARRVVNRVPNPAVLPFRWTLNAYRGCSHACVYCFARPTHEFLGLSSGEDFERRIVVKVNAVERLRAEIASPRWAGELIAMGTNTDPYQVAEGRYRLTRGVIEALVAAGNPFSVLTKSTLVLRDLDLLRRAAREGLCRVDISIGCLDRDVWRATEPGTPNPLRRVDAVARLNDAGVPCGVLMAPVLPGISDSDAQVEALVDACRRAGARSVSPLWLHLAPGVREHYLGWLADARPGLHREVAGRYRAARLPRSDDAALERRVRAAAARLGGPPVGEPRRPALRPAARPRPAQLTLC